MADLSWLTPTIGAVAVVMVPLISVVAAKTAGGPLRTRRSKRVLDQMLALEKETESTSPLVRAAAAQHKEALLKEMARMQFSYAPLYAASAFAIGYLILGLGAGENGNIQPEFMWLSLIMVAAGMFGFFALSHERRVMIERGRDPFPLLSPLRQNWIIREKKKITDRDERQLANSDAHEKSGDKLIVWQARRISRWIKTRKPSRNK